MYYVCLIYRAHVPHPLCVYSISQTDGILRKLCVLDAITMKRLLGGHSAPVQPLSTIVEAHVNIHNFSMIRSMFRPLLRWLLLLNIAFNEYDFLEKHGHLLLLPFDYWLIEKMRARSFSFSFQFKHWISQTVIQVLFALPIESTGASIFQHSIEMHQ